MAVVHQLPLADRVAVEAARVQTGRALATAAAALPYGLGWAAGRATVYATLATRWVIGAARVGWEDARGDGRAA